MPRTNFYYPLLQFVYWFLYTMLGATLAGIIVTLLVRQPIFSIEDHATRFIFWCCFEVVIWIARWIALHRLQAMDDWRGSIGWPTLGGELLVFGMFSGQLTVNDPSKMIDTIGFGLGLAGLFCLHTWAIRHARPGMWWVVTALVYAIGSLAIGLLVVTSVLVVVSTSRTTPWFSSHPLLTDVLSCLSAGAVYGVLSGVCLAYPSHGRNE